MKFLKKKAVQGLKTRKKVKTPSNNVLFEIKGSLGVRGFKTKKLKNPYKN